MAKKKEKAKRFFVLPTGERFEVIGETGRYFICADGIQFRKSANRGVIEKVKPEEKKEEE